MEKQILSSIEEKAHNFLIETGFKFEVINGERIYEHNGHFHKFTHVKGLSCFVIESAESKDEAINNLYEDSDLIPFSHNEDEVLFAFRNIIMEYYVD